MISRPAARKEISTCDLAGCLADRGTGRAQYVFCSTFFGVPRRKTFKNVVLQAHFDVRNPKKRGPEQGFCTIRRLPACHVRKKIHTRDFPAGWPAGCRKKIHTRDVPAGCVEKRSIRVISRPAARKKISTCDLAGCLATTLTRTEFTFLSCTEFPHVWKFLQKRRK